LLTATGAGSASQQSLGTVVFGGMIASTLLAIPFVPVFYILMQRIAERSAKRSRLGSQKASSSPSASA
jgi:HAE1 family hydrophobic/amphiphilic exporter-1